MPERIPYFSVAMLSAAALAYEVLLMRLFSIIQWHHFAYMIIGLALLGYGISGTVISIAQRRLQPRFTEAYIGSLLLFAFSSIGCFLAAQLIPFNAEEILWDGRQIIYLLSMFLLLTIPFFFAATAICLAFIQYRNSVSRVYAMDLLGAGIGSMGIVLLLFPVFPRHALILIGVFAIITAIVATWELQLPHRQWLGAGGLILGAILLAMTPLLGLNMSPYKGLEQILRIEGTRIIEQRSSPLGLLSVVQSRDIPLRHAPGLSLNATQEPLPQLGVFTDGDNLTAITQMPEDLQRLAYLDQVTSALAYHLNKPGRVLILGAGGGTDILQAKYHGITEPEAVELNPQLVDLVRDKYKDFTGGGYGIANANMHIGEARGFLAGTNRQYDLIQLALLDAFNASASGLYALNESYLYTIDALKLYISRLRPNGYLSITRWIKIPPRDTLKLFATAVEALEQAGVDQSAERLVLIRSWQTSTLLIKNGTYTPEELKAIQVFCDARSFDIAYTPAIKQVQPNQYNVLRKPYFHLGAVALLGDERNDFIEQYKFDLRPATDDRPYFHNFFKWSTLPEIYQLRGQGGMLLVEWGYIVLVATLIIAMLTSVLLILLPLGFFRRMPKMAFNTIRRTDVVLYFFALGLAFLFIEIAFMQKFILFLHHPIYAIAVILSAFLVFAGLGSYWSKRLARYRSLRQTLVIAVLGITLLSVGYLFALEALFAALVTLPISIKIPLTVLLIAPLAFCMGMPFPLGLASLAERAEQFIPWAWGINGCASVISAVLATLLAINFGFTGVILLAVLLYISVLLVFPTASR